jgi:hypothetical protein
MFDDERQTVLFTAGPEVIAEVLRQILDCEHCQPEADIRLNMVLDSVMQFSGAHTDYILSEAVTCPWCRGDIAEDTLVEWE